jgi:hypothetical protein
VRDGRRSLAVRAAALVPLYHVASASCGGCSYVTWYTARTLILERQTSVEESKPLSEAGIVCPIAGGAHVRPYFRAGC